MRRGLAIVGRNVCFEREAATAIPTNRRRKGEGECLEVRMSVSRRLDVLGGGCDKRFRTFPVVTECVSCVEVEGVQMLCY
jgi:hypothetical protein